MLFFWSHPQGSIVYVSHNIPESLSDIGSRVINGSPVDYDMNDDGDLISVIIEPESLSHETREITGRIYSQALEMLDHVSIASETRERFTN